MVFDTAGTLVGNISLGNPSVGIAFNKSGVKLPFYLSPVIL